MMQEKIQDIVKKIRDAEIVLVGLGEEFDDIRTFRSDEGYKAEKRILAESEKQFLIPAWQSMLRGSETHREASERLLNGLHNLAHVLDGKNYYVVSVSTNGVIPEIPWREKRLVMPCGSDSMKQCSESCPLGVRPLETSEKEKLQAELYRWHQSVLRGEQGELPEGLGICPECGAPLELNNIYHSNYNESGYLDAWEVYKKWLQGTLNRDVVILELGVGMQFPSVVRWPFEKVAFFNQKAHIYRVNEKLYQLTEEISQKGSAIAENAIDWLQNLC